MSGNPRNGGGRGRHCMVVHAYYPLGETRVEREAQALHAAGYQVDVICLRGPHEPASAEVDGVQVYRLPVRRHKGSGFATQLLEYLTFFALAFIRLTGLYRQRRYDVIQVHNLPDFLVFVALIPKLAGARVVLDLHDLMPEFYAERFHRPMDSLFPRIVRWQESLSCRFADHVITVTGLWRRVLIKRGLPQDKLSLVMNLADERIFYRHAEAGRSRNGGGLRLVYHGSMRYQYGLDLLLRAIDLIRQSAPDVHLVLHGGGEYLEPLIELAKELQLGDHVDFDTHLIGTRELANLIREADLAVVPYRDGVFTTGILPTKLMEYAALGLPAIAARTSAISAYFDQGMVEFFAPGDVDELADCILRLYRDRSRLAELARNITRFNERYNWADQSKSYLHLIGRLIEQGDEHVDRALAG